MKALRSLCAVIAMLALVALTATGCGGAQSLALRLTQGDQVQHHVVMDMEMTVTASGGGQSIPATKSVTHMEYDVALLVEKVTDNEATLTYTMSNMTGHVETLGQKQPIPGLSAETKLTITINPKTGKLIDITDMPNNGNGAGLSKDQLQDMIKELVVQLPENGQAKVGDTWGLEIKLPLAAAMTNNSVIKTSTKYEANETQDGLQVAKLSITGSGPLDVIFEEGPLKINMTGGVDINGVQYVDLKTGLPKSAESSGTWTMKSEGTENGQTMSMEIAASMHMVMTRK